MDSTDFKAAKKLLLVCKMCLTTKVSPDYTYPEGLLFVVYNSLAHLANRTGDVAQSVAYLEAGIEHVQDARV